MSLRTEAIETEVQAPGSAPKTLFGGLSVQFRPGTLTALIGPNASGKSTLLRHLVGIRPPTRGTIYLKDTRLCDLLPQQRARRIAYLPQATPLYTDLLVEDVVMLGRAPHLGRFRPPGPQDRNAVEAALKRVGLSNHQRRSLSQLSGGERQRVMLARLLAGEADILLLDEPTTGLDINHTLGFLEECRKLTHAGKTLVVAMHELDLARRYANRVICLSDSTPPSEGPTNAIMNPEHLGRVFSVVVQEHNGHIVFVPPNNPSTRASKS